ncbi:putative protein NRT1/ PTR FAMILY 2.14, partial [Mucuna pruriens]
MAKMSSLFSFSSLKRNSNPSLQKKLLDEESLAESQPKTHLTKPGWKAMPFILGNDTIERLATFGMQANFVVYLMKVYNMDQVLAAYILNTWLAVSNITPLVGAFVADAYLGKFQTIALSSFASLVVHFNFMWIDYMIKSYAEYLIIWIITFISKID